MTEQNTTESVEETTETTPLTFWKPKDDDSTLCAECGVKEMNNSLAVQLGLVPPYKTMQEVAERFENEYESGPDYFTESPTGTCVNCGETR